MPQVRTKPSSARSHSQAQDHTTDIVPLSERRGPFTLGLLWITMVTGFPTVLIGFEWYKAGLTLTQVLQGIGISTAIVLAYAIPATYLGAKSGQTYSLLSRNVFGAWGSRFVSTNLIWINTGWYALTAVLLAEGLKGLYHFDMPLIWLAPCLAIAMAFNNFFGFTGIANFARYLAAPILIAWVGYTFIKASAACPSAVLTMHPHVQAAQALTLVSSFAIGYAMWGNEADYWRYSQPKKRLAIAPLTISLLIGIVMFPITGWIMAYISGVTGLDAATRLMNQYAFGGLSFIAATVLVVSYFAMNDASLYGSINGFENIKELPHRFVVAMLAFAAVVVSIFFAQDGKALEQMATFSSVMLPCPTIIMLLEYFWFRPRSNLKSTQNDSSSVLDRVPSYDEIPQVCMAAMVALALGAIVGIGTSGLIPALASMRIGIYALQAWITSGVSYFVLRTIELNRTKAQQQKLEALVQIDPLKQNSI